MEANAIARADPRELAQTVHLSSERTLVPVRQDGCFAEKQEPHAARLLIDDQEESERRGDSGPLPPAIALVRVRPDNLLVDLPSASVSGVPSTRSDRRSLGALCGALVGTETDWSDCAARRH